MNIASVFKKPIQLIVSLSTCSAIVSTNTAESRPLLLVLCVQSVGHDDCADFADDVEGVLHHSVDKHPETPVDQQEIWDEGLIFWPLRSVPTLGISRWLLSTCLLTLRYFCGRKGAPEAALNVVARAGTPSLFEAVILQCKEPNKRK